MPQKKFFSHRGLLGGCSLLARKYWTEETWERLRVEHAQPKFVFFICDCRIEEDDIGFQLRRGRRQVKVYCISSSPVHVQFIYHKFQFYTRKYDPHQFGRSSSRKLISSFYSLSVQTTSFKNLLPVILIILSLFNPLTAPICNLAILFFTIQIIQFAINVHSQGLQIQIAHFGIFFVGQSLLRLAYYFIRFLNFQKRWFNRGLFSSAKTMPISILATSQLQSSLPPLLGISFIDQLILLFCAQQFSQLTSVGSYPTSCDQQKQMMRIRFPNEKLNHIIAAYGQIRYQINN